ncbi:MAG TPA: hypothetical protein EYP85_10690 [Armatimonadetes bacterium]|nr:hypothetical protein [Armatimonadota bacterium]
MTSAAEDFFARVITDRLKLDLLCYFHRNPFTIDYAHGTAQRLGADVQLVTRSLEELVQAGVLNVRQSQFDPSRPAVYSYTRNPEIRALVEEVVVQATTEEGRNQLLQRIAQK